LRDAAIAGAITGYRSLYPDYVFEPLEVWPSADDPRLAAVSTHNIRRFAPTIAGRPLHYFTLLREPRAQALSVLRYVQQERKAFGVPADVGAGSKDIARWLLDGVNGEPFENAQTNHIALYTWCDATRGRCVPELYAGWSAADKAAYRRERLDLAKSLLRSFLAVGIVERLPESLAVVRRSSMEVGINLLPAERITVANVTQIPPGDDVTWIDEDPLGQRLLESLEVDRELHAFAERLLDEAVETLNSQSG
jgi:hypothetical protein